MIGVSRCLCGDNCSYRGDSNLRERFKLMDEEGKVIKICPEVMGGLPIPRVPAEIVNEQPLMVMTKDGRDVTREFVTGARVALAILKMHHIKTVVLKSRSPSCGCGTIYDGTFSSTVIDGNGVFARMCLKEGIAVYNEDNYVEDI